MITVRAQVIRLTVDGPWIEVVGHPMVMSEGGGLLVGKVGTKDGPCTPCW